MYCGFRQQTATVMGYQQFANDMQVKQQLNSFHLALSREGKQEYVMDLIQQDALFFGKLLQDGGTVLICGSLAMQKDVEKVLDTICLQQSNKSIAFYKENGQVLTDCY